MKVFGYVRVSTRGQVEKGYSLLEQRERIIEYCKKNNLELLAIYEDKAWSGAACDDEELAIDREGYNDMMASIHMVEAVVVVNTSRLWRSDIAKVIIQRELRKANCDVVALERPEYSLYSEESKDILVNGLMDAIDVYERIEIRNKLTRGRNTKAKLGGFAGGGVPLGYTYLKAEKAIIIDEDKAPAVRRVFELTQYSPWLTLAEIAEVLNGEGHTTKRDKPFTATHIHRILKNKEFYEGYYKYGGTIAEGQHEPII